MRPLRPFSCRPALLLAALLVAAPAAPQAPPPGEPAAAEPDRAAELAEIRAEIARLEGELAGVSEREASASERLAAVVLDLALQEERLAEARTARDEAAARATFLEAEVERLGAELVAVRAEFRRRLAGLYRLGRQGYLRLVLAAEPRGEVLPALRLVRFLVRRDAAAFGRYRETRERFAAERDALLERRREVERWVAREEAARRSLARARARQEEVVSRLGGERRLLAERAAALLDRERKLAAFVDFLYGSQPGALSGRPIQEFRGALDWPVEGRVTVGFGPRRDPRYQTTTPHNGLELATAPDAPVRTVFPGRVLFAAPFRGYGPTVVVAHPGRVFTLYAGLAGLRVGRDAMVSLGDVVGAAGSTLYFEIRVENRPQDPRDWLRRSVPPSRSPEANP